MGRGRGRPGLPAVVADFCCGVGGDLMALVALGSAIGVDRNPVAVHFAAVNTGALARVADVAEFDVDGVTTWHIDPDRRPGGRRTTSLEWCEPSRATIEHTLQRVPDGAVKLAPATVVPNEWSEHCELEWISREPRSHADVIDAWRTSCPRLTVWEDAVDRGFAAREHAEGREVMVRLTESGRAFLRQRRPT